VPETTDHQYLGDGVYASHDGYQIWLHVGDHRKPPVVALEPEVLHELNNYAMRIIPRMNPERKKPT